MIARAIVVGSGGRMGKTVLTLATETEGIDAVYGVDPSSGTSFSGCPAEADVVIDFSTAAALPDTLSFCAKKGLPLILATTGHQDAALEAIDAAAEQIAILMSANLSYGALVLARLVREARALLPESFDVTIIETHHRMKKDAPSGTAKALAAAMGQPSAAMLSVRGGGVVGVHEVRFLGDMDGLALRHEAFDRRLFAKGALEAAKWILACPPGLYGIEDVYHADSK